MAVALCRRSEELVERETDDLLLGVLLIGRGRRLLLLLLFGRILTGRLFYVLQNESHLSIENESSWAKGNADLP